MSWNTCQWRWFRDYREGRAARIYSEHLEFGTAIHAALEHLKPTVKQLREGACAPSIDSGKRIFEERFRSSYGKVRDRCKKPLTDKQIDEMVEAGYRVLDNLHHCKELTDAEVVFVEHPLRIKIDRTDEVEIDFKGFIDLVIRSKDKRGNSVLWVVDYKTCSWGWPKEKKQDENLQSQLRLYKHFLSKSFNLDPKQIRTAFVLLKKRPSDPKKAVEWLPISSGDKTVMRSVLRLNEAVTGMMSNDYTKNRDACINPFGEACPYLGTDLCLND